PVTRPISVRPASMASSTPYCTSGLLTMGSISLGMALVAGRKRVPYPATGNKHFFIIEMFPCSWLPPGHVALAAEPSVEKTIFLHRESKRQAAENPEVGLQQSARRANLRLRLSSRAIVQPAMPRRGRSGQEGSAGQHLQS